MCQCTGVTILSIELKELWKNEALNFTPWLAKSGIIEEIIDELNIFNNPLKLYKTEHKIGNYRIDMTYQTLDKKKFINSRKSIWIN